MSKFIAVNDVYAEGHKEVLVNLDWVEEMRPTKDGGTCIYFAFSSNNSYCGQDRLVTDAPFMSVRQRILGRMQ